MSTKDAVGNGNAAMMEAAMKSLSTGAADSAESTARRTARAGARRGPCVLIGHRRTEVGLEPGSIGKVPDVQAVRAGSTAVLKAGITYRLCHRAHGDGGCHDPEPILTDLLSHE